MTDLILAGLVVVSVAGCSQRIPDEYAVDSWGEQEVRVVNNDSGPRYETPVFEFRKDLVIGGIEDGPDWQLFASAPRLLVGPEGLMVMGDGGREELFLIDREGRLLKRFGGLGSGPGEFQNLWYMHWADWGVEFWVEDQHLNRVTRFSADGDLLGTFNYGRERLHWSRFIDIGGYRWLSVSRPESLEKRIDHYAVMVDRFNLERMFIELEGQQFLRIDRTGWPKPFRGIESALPFFNTEKILVSRPYDGELCVYDLSGKPLFRIEKEWEVSRVSRVDIAWWKGSRGGVGGREYIEQMDFPERRPLFAGARTDDRGRIWITRSRRPRQSADEENPPTVMDIFGPDGIWIGTITPPVYPFYIWGDFVYYVPYVEDEGPRIERWEIKPLVPEAAGDRLR